MTRSKFFLFAKWSILLLAVLFVRYGETGQSLTYDSKDVTRNISSISDEDRARLDAFFRTLLFRNPFAYVLYGDKAIAIASYTSKEPTTSRDYGGMTYSRLSMKNTILREGWLTWEKHCHLFPSKNFILHPFHGGNERTFFLLLINRTAFQEVFNKNHSDFIRAFGPDITAEQMIRKLLTEESMFGAEFEGHHDLMGYLFGFGTHNAQLYQKRGELAQLKERYSFLNIKYQSVLKELTEITATLHAFEDGAFWRRQFMMPLPSFGADPEHWETKMLKKKYKKQRKWVLEHYKKGDFLELTLEQYTRPLFAIPS